MAEEVNGVATKLALGDVDDQAVLLESLEQQAEVFFVCLNILASHQDVINIDEGEIQTVTGNVHQALESLGSIHQAERHPEKLIQPERSDDGGFGDILSGHRDLVVASRRTPSYRQGEQRNLVCEVLGTYLSGTVALLRHL